MAKVLYNNGALKIELIDMEIAPFRLHFECAGVQKTLFLTDEQVSLMERARVARKASSESSAASKDAP